MRKVPTVKVYCDGCGKEKEITLERVGREGLGSSYNTYDERNLNEILESFGWILTIDKDSCGHDCPGIGV